MKKELLIETTMQFGEVRAMPIDHVRAKNKESISIEYDCLYIMEPINREPLKEDSIDQIKVPHDTLKFKYIPRGESFLLYTLKKICYELNKDKNGIQNLKLIYLNLNGQEEVLLDTSEGKVQQFSETIEFEDGEIIESVIVYIKKDILCGFDISTNKQMNDNNKRSILIGIRSNETAKDEAVMRVSGDNKVVVGIQCYANEQYGVSSISFHRVDKLTFSIYQTYGFRQLRAKIKKNEAYVKELEGLKPKLTEEQKLLSDSCGLPDSVFFSVLKYVMPY